MPKISELTTAVPTGDDLIVFVDNADNTTKKSPISSLPVWVGDMTKAVYDPININQQLVGTTATQTLTNKTLTSPAITTPTGIVKGDVWLGNVDNTSDATKNSATVTLTNKTLTTPAIASIKGTLTADTDGATITFNKNTSDFHSVTMAGNRTLALSNMAAGDRIVLRLQQDATGSRTVTWFTTIKWANWTVPTLTTTPSKADMFGFLCTSAGNYDWFIIGQNI